MWKDILYCLKTQRKNWLKRALCTNFEYFEKIVLHSVILICLKKAEFRCVLESASLIKNARK